MGVGQSTVLVGDPAPVFPGGTSSPSALMTSSNNSALALTGPMSVELWVNVPSTITSGFLFTQSFQSGGLYPAYIAISSGTNPYFTMQVNTTAGTVSVYGTPVLGQPNHVVMTWDGTTLTGYVNGAVSGTAQGSGTLATYSSPYTGFTVGGPSGQANGFNGSIADVALYSGALSATRVQAHYSGGTAAPAAPGSAYAASVVADSPAVYYPMTETSGSTASDASGSNLSGSYGSGVSVGTGAVVSDGPAPVFPGGPSTSSSLMHGSTDVSLIPSGAMSVELWANIPSTLPSSGQMIFTQPYQSGSQTFPTYIAVTGGTNPYFSMYVQTTSGVVNVYGTPVLGAPNHIALTWDGTTLTGYVNGAVSGTATGSGSISNVASPYTGFTVGGSSGQQDGFSGAVGEVAYYTHVLSASRVAAHYSAGKNAQALGTLIWQTAANNWNLAVGGQCGGPVINGDNASFTTQRDTTQSYYYEGFGPWPGASSCQRNQINPKGTTTTNFNLTMGRHYTWTFQTVLKMNGNYTYGYPAPANHLAADLPAIVWQTHNNAGGQGPCDVLTLNNTEKGQSINGSLYPNIPSNGGGLPIWGFHTCDDANDFAGDAWYSSDTLYDGEVDNWQIDVTAELSTSPTPSSGSVQNSAGGTVVLRRNGSIVYSGAKSVCDSGNAECWWNFGPYTFMYANSEEPANWNPAAMTIDINHMKLYQQ